MERFIIPTAAGIAALADVVAAVVCFVRKHKRATTAARATPPKLMATSPMVKDTAAPPMQRIRTAAKMIWFLELPKFTGCRVRRPVPATKPNRMMEMPPTTEPGMVWSNAETLGQKPSRMANTAAMRITTGSHTFVRASTPVFSE